MTPEERSELAGEYALGVLDGDDFARARELAAADAQFAEEIAGWSGRLAPLLDEVDPVSAPPRVLAAIEQRLGNRDRSADNVLYLRRRVNVWRGFAVGASALAASLALVLVMPPQTVQQPPATQQAPAPMVAMMEAEGSEARLVATWDPDDQSLVVAAAAGIAPVAGHSHQLWVIPADGTPRSMGILPGADPMHLRIDEPMARQLAEGATIALSVEPSGGSPTGLPTGPVIAAGKLQQT
ncbi:anti-sigma factor [Sphingomonas sp.]|uniref:anti-sigma factor n=1 Tax=Sphingomonas sp. TaxID=28214 RepID=UPI0025D81EB3|nr:anti-sigma factor [Sphingomonas sp.]